MADFGLGLGRFGGGEQPLALRLGALALGDVPGDLRRPDDRAVGIADRRDAERDVDDPPVLREPLGLEVADALAPPDTLQDPDHVLGMVRRHQGGDGLADDLGGGVAQDPLGGLIPARDDPVERLADDGIVRRFDDGCQHRPRILGLPEGDLGRVPGSSAFADRLLRGVSLAHVVEDEDDALDAATIIRDGCGRVVDRAARPVLGREVRMIGEADHDALAQHPRDGVLDRLAGDLIGDTEDVLERLPACLFARPSRQRLGHRVQEGDAPLAVGRNHRVAHAAERRR